MTPERARVRIASVPALLVHGGNAKRAGGRGTVLFYHWLTGSKEEPDEHLTALARAGFLVVALDNAGHGERRLPDFEQRLSAGPEVESELLALVRATAQEAPAVIDDLIDRGLSRPDRIGVAGISMGAHISYAAVVADDRIRVATPIVGSPQWNLPSSDSPHLHPEKFFPCALLSQTASEDTVVPPDPAREFHRALEPYYASAPDRLRYVECEGVGHLVPPRINEQMRRNMVDWFERFLPHDAE